MHIIAPKTKLRLCLFLFIFSQYVVNGQVTYQDLKSALIIKLSNSIHWSNETDIDSYQIGIYGIDTSTYNRLTSISARIKINKKPFNVSWVHDLKVLDQYQLIYVDQSRSADLTKMVKRIERKNILLISEQSVDTKNIMLNLLYNLSDEILSFEVNKANLIIENFTFTDQLLLLGGSEVDLRNLYHELKISLEIEKKEVEAKSTELVKKQNEIKSFQKKIEEHKDSLKILNSETSFLQQNIKLREEELNLTSLNLETQKLILQRQFVKSEDQSTKIKLQIERINKQELSIGESINTLDSLSYVRNELMNSLEEQELTIITKQSLIESQKKLLFFFILFSIVLAALSFVTYRTLWNKRKIAKKLEDSNALLNDQHKSILHLNKDLETFNHSITHDLRAPLRAIEGFVDVIKEEYFDKPDKEAKRLFGIIQANITRMSDLIRDLLKFSKMGNEELKLKSCDLNELIKLALVETGNSFNQTKVKVNKLPVKWVDRSMMQQVFVNLLSNAFKFSKNQTSPEIEIGSYKSEEGKDIVFIKDNGVGFDMNYKNKLFSIFQRLHSEEDFEGTGIGLSIVKRIIDKHHGEIWTESKIDQGTTFFLSLP